MNFDEWWNEDYDDKDNHFEKDSFGYWAYAGWRAAMHALRQELVQQNLSDSIRPKGKSIVKVWVDEINQALAQSDHGFDRTASHMAGEYVDTAEPNREWVGLTNDEIDNLNLSNKIKIKQLILLIETKLKEKNLCR